MILEGDSTDSAVRDILMPCNHRAHTGLLQGYIMPDALFSKSGAKLGAKAAAAILLILPLICVSATTNKEKFTNAYAAYQQHLAANEATLALAFAQDAYRLGKKLFGKDSVNTANLATNYAALLNDAGRTKKAGKLLKGKLTILEERFGANAKELVPVLTELGRVNLNEKMLQLGLSYFRRAAALAELESNPLYAAQQNFDIAKMLMNRGFHSSSESFMRTAHEKYAAKLQSNDVRLGLTSYQMAVWALSRRQHDAAIPYLDQALTAFKTDDKHMGDLERTVRYRLVETYETMGDRQAATEHCVTVGARQDWISPPEPLFATQAAYPQAAVEKKLSGEVVLGFTVDENGFVADASVTQSTDAVFDSAALDMIQQYRYAPRFEGGIAVATGNLQFTASFDLRVEKSGGGSKLSFQRPPLPGFPTPVMGDPSLCGDPTDTSGRCGNFGVKGK